MLLNCHTYYSFCYGTLAVEELLAEVLQKGYSQFVLSDINNTSACLDTIRLATEKGIKPIVGIDFRNHAQQQYIGIAQNNEGFKELNQHLSLHLHSGLDFEAIAPEFSHVYIVYPLNNYKGWKLKENEFVGISIKELANLPFLPLAQRTSKMVALQTVTFANKKQFNAHRLLRAIDTNNLLSKLPKTQQAKGSEIMPFKNELYAAYGAYPNIIANTEQLLNNCEIHFEYGKLANKNLKYYTTDKAMDMQLLREECRKGLLYRYPNPSGTVLNRMEKELQVIEQLNFASYFLINWDIINYAQHKNYYYVGRGSGANSIIAYLLRITDVDPIELDLYFERFINIYRSNAPDFDMDFSWTDRDDITAYIFKNFGLERTALLGAYNTFQHDAVIRELGKVFGLPAGEIDKLQQAHRYPDIDEIGKLVLKYSEVIKGFPSHLSIHSSGIIISEAPIHYYSATSMPPKGYPTTQFSMLEAEDIGLYKFDILSQRGLGKIKDTLDIVKENKGVEIDIHQVAQFKQDEEVKKLLRKGNTIGCFYVESPAMRMLLAKLKADDYLRLVAASSIIRPGVAKSGMMREYIVRFRDESLRKKARERLPELYDLLEETYGVMVYQEDVIKIAHFFADLTLAEADYLRRGMSWKYKQRSEFWKVKQNFFDNCDKKGYDVKLVTEIWLQIESFANFAFSKGHSASYAVESYQALFLKAYYPLEYMVATLNNGGGFYRKELYVHEARKHGAMIIPPCVNNSGVLCRIKGNKIYLGLNMIAELELHTIEHILEARRQNGSFKNVLDFIKRVSISIEQIRLLIRVGAFNFTGRNKKELLWEIHPVMRPTDKKKAEKELFETNIKTWQLPVLTDTKLDEAFDEIELLGFPLCSPFDLLKDEIKVKLTARELEKNIGKTVIIVGYLVTIKYTQTSKGERMYFGTFTDLEGNWIDTVHFPPSAKQYPFSGPGTYIMRGKVVEEYDFISIEVDAMKRLPMIDREAL
ncbi:MAG: DNA polymerase III subunit alpha [Bacteroidota bacterium]|nr:DNA polymerase III subunit alpha [Bacteroidota bacterium]